MTHKLHFNKDVQKPITRIYKVTLFMSIPPLLFWHFKLKPVEMGREENGKWDLSTPDYQGKMRNFTHEGLTRHLDREHDPFQIFS